jgi:hypothetical protein
MYQASAIYESTFPMGWIGARPADYDLVSELGEKIPNGWREVVIDRNLACGIKITAEVRGLTAYDFSGWRQGVAEPVPDQRHIITIGQVMEASKPAMIWRLRVINSHQTLLHAAAMFHRNESPLVTRVNAFDLYSFEYPDDCGGGTWYGPLGEMLPSAITLADRRRIGVMPITTFELSLDWLQAVVERGALIEVDLLNQAQAALATHDYALAVVAGWTICELRISRLSQLPGKESAKKKIEALRQSGVIAEALADRLHGLRNHRNNWLHSGKEPDQGTASEAALLAAQLLRTVIPDLNIRPPMDWVVL